MRLAVIYDSRTGNTKQAAEWIVDGMRCVEGVEAEAYHIGSVDEDYVRSAKGVVIGSPSYCAQITPDLHTWLLEKESKLDLAGKLGGGFATAQFTHGGGDIVIQSILTIELVAGMLVYSSGGEYGSPYIHLGPVAVNQNKEPHNGMEHYKDLFMIFGERFAKKATELFG